MMAKSRAPSPPAFRQETSHVARGERDRAWTHLDEVGPIDAGRCHTRLATAASPWSSP